MAQDIRLLLLITLLSVLVLAFILWNPKSEDSPLPWREVVLRDVAKAMASSGIRFVSNTVDGVTAVTTSDEYYGVAWRTSSVKLVQVGFTFTFASAEAIPHPYHTGSLEDLYTLYGRVVEGVTNFTRENFTEAEFEHIVGQFVIKHELLFVPTTGSKEENSEFFQFYGVRTLSEARQVIRS